MTIDTLERARQLVSAGDVRISDHGYDELAEDKIRVRDVLDSLADAKLVEDHPGFGKGPSVLVLQRDHDRNPIHVVRGIPKGADRPAVLVTAYRPDSTRWSEDFMERRK